MARRSWDSSSKASTHQRGYGWAWQQKRQRILERDHGLCCVCRGRGKVTLATEVDHITQKASGGTDDDENLQSICDDCHTAKTDAENGRVRREATGLDGWPVAN